MGTDDLLIAAGRQSRPSVGVDQEDTPVVGDLAERVHPVKDRLLGAGQRGVLQEPLDCRGDDGVFYDAHRVFEALLSPGRDLAGLQIGDGGKLVLDIFFDVLFLKIEVEVPREPDKDRKDQEDEDQPGLHMVEIRAGRHVRRLSLFANEGRMIVDDFFKLYQTVYRLSMKWGEKRRKGRAGSISDILLDTTRRKSYNTPHSIAGP